MDKRRNRRIRLRLEGQLTVGSGDNHATETVNVSLRGACIDYPAEAAELQQRCFLTLFVADESLWAATFRGHIAFRDGDRCGVSFDAVDRNDFRRFSQLLGSSQDTDDTIGEEIAQGDVPRLEDWQISSEPSLPPAH